MTPCVARLLFSGVSAVEGARSAVLVGMRPTIRRDFRADLPRCWTMRRLGYESPDELAQGKARFPTPLWMGRWAGHGDSRIPKRRPGESGPDRWIAEHHFRTVGHGGRSTLFA